MELVSGFTVQGLGFVHIFYGTLHVGCSELPCKDDPDSCVVVPSLFMLTDGCNVVYGWVLGDLVT